MKHEKKSEQLDAPTVGIGSTALVGAFGWLPTSGEKIRVKIIAVNPEKTCPKCGGPWGTVETQGHAMMGSGMMSVDGTTGEGCLNDVIVDDTDRDRASAPTTQVTCPDETDE